ncbi:MAG: hypothetical protein ACREQJ_14875 [Candidatus Binatia bacterium]
MVSATALFLLGSLLGSEPCDVAPYFSPRWLECEIQNALVALENQTAQGSLMPEVAAATFADQQARFAALAADPERRPHPNSCSTGILCPVDPRLVHWADGAGLVEPVLYTSRSGATISGHVWATASGPAKRPGVVIINGSIVGYEEAYWYVAQALAKARFVVLTFDAQGEGASDQLGEAPDELEAAFAGIPVLGLLGPDTNLGGNGRPFYDGGTDALDFLVSTPAAPYVPRPSRTTGTSHAAKHERRVAEGRNAAFNPFWELLDPEKIGVAGHSYGAVAASWLGQSDPRLDAVVAWDDLCVPVWPSPDEFFAFGAAGAKYGGGYGLPTECFGAPEGPAPALVKPALAITADYLAPSLYFAPPDPTLKSAASLAYSAAGADTGSIIVRGGNHLEFTDIPGAIPTSLRGIDLATWYTAAWFTKYLLEDPAADAMLLTTRWRDDARTAAVDPGKDANLFSWHYRSRLDVALAAGGRFVCENLRAGCEGQTDAAEDGGPADYSFVAVDTAPDTP